MFSLLQLSLVSHAQPSLTHNQHVSGHIHALQSQAINIIWSLASMDIHVWFHAVKIQSLMNTLSHVKSFEQFKRKNKITTENICRQKIIKFMNLFLKFHFRTFWTHHETGFRYREFVSFKCKFFSIVLNFQ